MGKQKAFDEFAKGRHIFRGKVKKVLFTDPSSDFFIFWAEDLDNPRDRDKKVKGNFFDPAVRPGATFKSAGSWEKHPKYGPTFASEMAIPYVVGFDHKRSYLCSNLPSLSSVKAAKILKELGPKPFEQLDDDALGTLSQLNCVSYSEAETIASEYERLREYGRISRYLLNLQVPSGRVKAIFQELGVDAIQKIHENPYAISLAEGVSFVLADRVALKMGFAPDSEFRIASITEYLLELSSRRAGHLFVPKSRLTPTINSLPSRKRVKPFGRQLTEEDVENALEERIKKNRIVVDDKDRVYLEYNYRLEQDCADIISDMSEDVHDLGIDTDQFIKEYERVYGIRFSKNQAKAIHTLNSSKILLVTGLPGTGKSTIAKAFVRLFKYAEKDFVLMSPTGIAAKNIEKIVGEEAGTIHRMLGYDGTSWGYGPDKKFPTDAVLVDEMSMVDQELLFRLLSALKEDTIVVLIGDHAQLPSVGAGNVLHEMIESDVINQVHLTEIFRQSSASDIVINSHRINSGQDLLLKNPTNDDTDFRFVSIDDPQKIVAGIKHVVKGLFDSPKDHTFQVLSPTYNGSLGVDALNDEIKQLLNPPKPQLLSAKIGGKTYQKEDRVMITQNDYNLNVYNGEVGKLYKVNQREKEIEVKIFDEPRNRVKAMSFDKANHMLTLAYAMTVHKCVDPSTLVETRNGLVPIESIPQQGEIATANGIRYYQNKVENPERDAFEITTSDGYSITVTPEHKMFVWTSEGLQKVEATDLEEGQYLPLKLGMTVDADSPSELPSEPKDVDIRTVHYPVPEVMNEKLAEFLGLMVADGTIRDREFKMSKRHKDVVDRFEYLTKELFGIEAARYKKRGAYFARYCSTYLVEWFRAIGGLDPHNKAIPSCVLASPIGIHAAFLRGLFEDGSVNVSSSSTGRDSRLDYVELSSSNQDMLQQVQVMLLRFGIISVVREYAGRVPSLYIYGQNAKRFGEKIGFVSSVKQNLIDGCGLVGKETMYRVPVTNDELKNEITRQGMDISLYQNALRNGYMSRHIAENLDDNYDFMEDRLGYHFSPIESIERTTASSMCVEVPDGGEFLANGFKSSNSQGNQWDYVIMPFHSMFSIQLQRNLLYTAVTRAEKKVFIFGQRNALEKAVANNSVSNRNTAFAERLMETCSKGE